MSEKGLLGLILNGYCDFYSYSLHVKYILVVFRSSIYNVSKQCISTRQFTVDVSYLDEHVHRQRDVQGRFALLHLQTVQALLQPHFTNSLHALDAS